MDKYAAKAGFRLIKQYSIYVKIPFINKTSVYLAKDIRNTWKLDMLEKLPLKKGNLIRMYRKE